jgi:hypothetical protein
MENLLDKIIKHFLFLFILLLLNCKKSDNKKTVNDLEKKEIKCLKENDTPNVKEFLNNLEIAFSKNDTIFISKQILFPYTSNETKKTDEKYFFENDYEILKSYLNIKNIPKDEIESLKREEYFEKVKNSSDCFNFVIYNTFEELEFTVIVYISKTNNQLKVSKIMLAG